MKSALAALVLATALLAGCGKDDETPAPASTAAQPAAADVASTPVADNTPAPTAAEAAAGTPATGAERSDQPAAPGAAAATEAADTASATGGAAGTATSTDADSAAASATATPASATPAVSAAEIAPLRGPEPVEGTDYTLIDPPAPMAPASGKIEVAEVFAYYCIHCATMQKLVTTWKATLPADVDFKYVPTAHAQSEPFARAFYAAEAMGILPATHEAMFENVAVKRAFKTGQADEIAQMYGALGHDAGAVLSTMQSFAVNAQIARAQKAVTRWAIEATPTFVVAGKYKVSATPRGQQGVLDTIEHLIARERAAMGTNPAP